MNYITDPYRRCEDTCTHDTTSGVLVSELLTREGPWPDSNPLLSTLPLIVGERGPELFIPTVAPR